MPDIQTALSKVLDAWEKDEEITNQTENQVQNQPKKHLFKPTNNVTRSTFDLIRANPGITRKEAYRILEQQGYKMASTASLVSAFIRQGQVELTDGKMFATSNEYIPLKGGKDKPKAFKEAVAIIKTKPVKAAPQPQARQDKQERRVMDIEEWLNEVPLMQARLVYMRLKAIFEGDTNA